VCGREQDQSSRYREHDLDPDVDEDQFLHRADAFACRASSFRASFFVCFARRLSRFSISRAAFCVLPDPGDGDR
jgi:hypothetical protein